jgi:hypothetical protein
MVSDGGRAVLAITCISSMGGYRQRPNIGRQAVMPSTVTAGRFC